MRSIENCNKQLIYAMSNVQLCQVFCPVHELVKSLPVSIWVYKSLSKSIRTMYLSKTAWACPSLSCPFLSCWSLFRACLSLTRLYEPFWAYIWACMSKGEPSIAFCCTRILSDPSSDIKHHQNDDCTISPSCSNGIKYLS